MKYCPKCGTQNEDSADFCMQCGENLSQQQQQQYGQQQFSYQQPPYIGMTRAPSTVVLLSIVTCGVYAIYWYYKIMQDLNGAYNREIMNPVQFLLLSMFCCPLLIWYIFYKIDKGLAELSYYEGVQYKENFTLWLLLTLVFGIGSFVAMVQITNGFNALWARRSGAYGVNPNQGPTNNGF